MGPVLPMTAQRGQRKASDHKVQQLPRISAGPQKPTSYNACREIRSETLRGQSRFSSSSTSSEPLKHAISHRTGHLHGALLCCPLFCFPKQASAVLSAVPCKLQESSPRGPFPRCSHRLRGDKAIREQTRNARLSHRGGTAGTCWKASN